MSAKAIQAALQKEANSKKAKVLSGFFKTGPGQYGEGDIFLGVTAPELRKIALQFADTGFSELKDLLQSPIHEHRSAALLILVNRYQNSDVKTPACRTGRKKQVFDFYLKNLKGVNNWDLVDTSAHWIVGAHLEDKDRSLLGKLAGSKDLWERRVGIVATWHYIRQGDPRETFRISEILLNDPHDLIHKAAGWMLRETGKHCKAGLLEAFLDKYATRMPRTMLRYAIERFPEKKRKNYLAIKKRG